MNLFNWKEMSHLDRFLFIYVPGMVIAIISLLMTAKVSSELDMRLPSILVFAVMNCIGWGIYLIIQFFMQSVLLFYKCKDRNISNNQPNTKNQNSDFADCLNYPEYENEIFNEIYNKIPKKINNRTPSWKTLAHLDVCAKKEGIIKPDASNTVIIRTFNANTSSFNTNHSKYMEGKNLDGSDEEAEKIYREFFKKLKEKYDNTNVQPTNDKA